MPIMSLPPAVPQTLRKHPSPLDTLQAEPHRFGFFQAVRLLGMLGAVPGEDVRFRNSLSLSFPASEIEAMDWQLRPDDQGHIPQVAITPAFMGLLGASGALPLVYTEQLAQVESQHRHAQDEHPAARAFLDVFSNRALTLFHQAWRKHRLHLQFESDRRQRFMPLVLALAGLGQKGLQGRFDAERDGLADEALAYHAGALQQRALSAGQMRQILQDYLGVPVQIEQFVGRWYTVPDGGRTLLGMSGQLGCSALLGDRVWQRDLRMRVSLGPLNHAQFRRFLPGHEGARALASLLTLCQGLSLEYEVCLQLKRQAVQGLHLSATGQAQLGWDTFLQTAGATQDRSDVRYEIHAAA